MISLQETGKSRLSEKEFRASLGSARFHGSLGTSDAANVAEGDTERHDGGFLARSCFSFAKRFAMSAERL
jgi:hypothetical protein